MSPIIQNWQRKLNNPLFSVSQMILSIHWTSSHCLPPTHSNLSGGVYWDPVNIKPCQRKYMQVIYLWSLRAFSSIHMILHILHGDECRGWAYLHGSLFKENVCWSIMMVHWISLGFGELVRQKNTFQKSVWSSGWAVKGPQFIQGPIICSKSGQISDSVRCTFKSLLFTVSLIALSKDTNNWIYLESIFGHVDMRSQGWDIFDLLVSVHNIQNKEDTKTTKRKQLKNEHTAIIGMHVWK